jgi:hypothetical protein
MTGIDSALDLIQAIRRNDDEVAVHLLVYHHLQAMKTAAIECAAIARRHEQQAIADEIAASFNLPRGRCASRPLAWQRAGTAPGRVVAYQIEDSTAG